MPGSTLISVGVTKCFNSGEAPEFRDPLARKVGDVGPDSSASPSSCRLHETSSTSKAWSLKHPKTRNCRDHRLLLTSIVVVDRERHQSSAEAQQGKHEPLWRLKEGDKRCTTSTQNKPSTEVSVVTACIALTLRVGAQSTTITSSRN